MVKLVLSIASLWLALCVSATAAPAEIVSDTLTDLAPGGQLRAAINFGNPVLAQRDPDTGLAAGVSVALARELAWELGVPVVLVPFDEAGQVVDALKSNAWDVAFLAVDPARAGTIDFTAAYAMIEGTYLVPAASPLKRAEDVDRNGVRIGVAAGSAYDLYLSRSLKHAELVRTADTAAATDLFRRNQVDALACIRQPLADYARAHSDARVLDDDFMEIPQAMGMPKGRPAGARFLRSFIDEMKSTGFVAKAFGVSGQPDVIVPPREQ
ncbi:ABC transporter substrate-binding protein [Aliidongia dinghuensis]|uniref:ABC transporter substrate-binding protein n=1 Tax=Aliidongia dinghuensis TaxID=1867774 RepID=A0A8J2YWR0_9PROT|nr:ABC transporter substrate-binding protein [Aliidongia dinghuensis]GGF30475.1 ABC transporter substrate-binding protein [Aliidongia dinghuensis]